MMYVFCGIERQPGHEHHIKLKKVYEPVHHPLRSVPVKLKPSYNKELQQLCMNVLSHQCRSTSNGQTP